MNGTALGSQVTSLDTSDSIAKRDREGGSFVLQLLRVRQSKLDSALARHENLFVTGILLVLGCLSLLLASRAPFTVDEYLVRITDLHRSPSQIWHLLKTAPLSVDPPVFHILTSYFLRLFGDSEFATRLLPAFAYGLMSFLLYRFVRRYWDVYSGLLALVLCAQCGAFPFSYEARPYTMVLAAASAALVSWTNLIERGKRRYLAALGLFVGIAVAVGSHWLGFLVLIPLTFGEAVLCYQKRRVDFLTAGAIVAGAATVLCYLPLLKAASAYRAMPWKGVAFSDISDSFFLILQPCVFPAVLLLISLTVVRFFGGVPFRKRSPSRLPLPVFVCMVSFAVMPFFTFGITKLLSGAFQPRYALLCTLGLLPLVAIAVRDGVRNSKAWMTLAILLIGSYAAFSHYRQFSGEPPGGDTATFAKVNIFQASPALPIASARSDIFLRLYAHGPEAVLPRCVLLTDPASVRLLRQNTNFLMSQALAQWTSLPILSLSSFVHTNPKFYVLEDSATPGWLLPRLLEEHTTVAYEGTYAGYPVYRVESMTQQ